MEITAYKPAPSFIDPTQNDESLAQQLEDLIVQYRAHMGDKDPTQLLAIMQKMEDFLTKNGSLILEQCAREGYGQNSPDWTAHYATFLNQSMTLLKQDIEYHKEHPTSPLPSPDLINEMLTQLHYIMTHPK